MSKMNCLHCATNIPVLANICPNCHSETVNSKTYHSGLQLAGTYGMLTFFALIWIKWWFALIVAIVVTAYFQPKRPVLETPSRNVRIVG